MIETIWTNKCIFNSSYQWIMKHGGIPTEDSYGNYLGIDGFCHVDDPSIVMGLQVGFEL